MDEKTWHVCPLRRFSNLAALTTQNLFVSFQQRRNLRGHDAPVHFVVNDHGRRHSAVTRAGHLFHSEPLCLRSVSNRDVHVILYRTEDAQAMVRRAGFSPADSNKMPARRLSPEV